jgi:hypothetical protein
MLEGDPEPLFEQDGDSPITRLSPVCHLRLGPVPGAKEPGIAERAPPDQDTMDVSVLYPPDELLH